jgi:glucuronate isomerase
MEFINGNFLLESETARELSACDQLPKTILYNLDPAKNYPFAPMCGNFFETNELARI